MSQRRKPFSTMPPKRRETRRWHQERPDIESSERLQRVMAARGVASRRQAEAMIQAGRVAVDGVVITRLGTKVDPNRAEIRLDGRLLQRQAHRYLLLNKPQGYITTTDDERGRQTVMDLVQVRERVFPVGRLDRETEGLLLLTNDGEVANRVMHPRYKLAKEYSVLTDLKPPEAVLARIRSGMMIDGKRIVPEEIRILRETRQGVLLTITVHEGLNRVVRKIMEDAGVRIELLRRLRLGPLALGSIPLGTFRDLTPGELTSLFQALKLDRGEQQESAPRPRERRGRTAETGQSRSSGSVSEGPHLVGRSSAQPRSTPDSTRRRSAVRREPSFREALPNRSADSGHPQSSPSGKRRSRENRGTTEVND